MELEDRIKTEAKLYRKITNDLYEDIMTQRDKILAAFVAEYGCKPSEIRQVYSFNGRTVSWWVEKKNTG